MHENSTKHVCSFLKIKTPDEETRHKFVIEFYASYECHARRFLYFHFVDRMLEFIKKEFVKKYVKDYISL